MTENIVGSRMPPKNNPGQNGSPAPSVAPINEVAKFNVRNPAALAVRPKDPALTNPDVKNWQTRAVDASPIKSATGMKNPNASPAKVPGVTSRADKTGVVRPTR